MEGYKLMDDEEMVDLKERRSLKSAPKSGASATDTTSDNLSHSNSNSSLRTPISQNVVNVLHAVEANRTGSEMSFGWQHYFNQLDSEDMQLIQQCGKVVSQLDQSDWNFKHTASYWVAMNFIFGSLVFTTGSFFWLYELNPTQAMALVDYPYFAGSFTFSLGAYISWWETMNFTDPPPPKTVWVSFKNRNISWWICWWYVVGTTFYYGNTLTNIDAWKLPPSWSPFAWWMGFFGGLGFTIAGLCEVIAHKGWKFRPHKMGWWVSWFNFFGGSLFAVAAAIGFYFEVSPEYALAAKWSYLIGSFLYLIGSILSLTMWKTEQFGLAFMPELNLTEEKNKRNTVSFVQLPFLFMYCCTSAISVTGLVYSWCADDYWDHFSTFILALVIPTGVLCLGSVIHRVPEEPPYSYLLWFLRFIMAWLTMNIFMECWRLNDGEFPKCE